MRLVLLILMLIPTSTLAQGSMALAGRAYNISASGSDAANGLTTGTAWLTPNHTVNCADVIYAAASTSYAYTNFTSHKWGAVSGNCGNQIARVICSTFDACKMSGAGGVLIDANYWSIQGFEVTTSNGGCFLASPSSSANIHHIVFANDVANGCFNGGFGAYPTGGFGVDYTAVVGSIAFNAAQASVHCYSGISVYEPYKSDSVAGTHIYAGGNYSFNNQDPNPCQGTAPTDGDGLIYDTFDCSQNGCTNGPYDQQAYMTNNISVGNGGWGIEVQNNSAGSTHAPIYVKYNTDWKNRLAASGFNTSLCADAAINTGLNVTFQFNIIQTTVTKSCPPSTNFMYGFVAYQTNGTSTVSNNWVDAFSGGHLLASSSTGFSFGGNTTGTDAGFSGASVPSGLSCGSSSSVPNCMSTLVSNFVALAPGANVFGYQPISPANGTDSLFPKWVCGNIPAGLVTMSC